ncbi:hypothetical protein D3C84_980540 [compost metagenome]
MKTSSRSDATKVSIHGIDQLAPPVGGSLHLAHVRMERAEGGQLSVGALFNSLIRLGGGNGALDKGLGARECTDPHAAEWNRLCFSLEGVRVYSVGDEFPRVVDSNFSAGCPPPGVSALEYEVDLNHAIPFELSLLECGLPLKRIAG